MMGLDFSDWLDLIFSVVSYPLRAPLLTVLAKEGMLFIGVSNPSTLVQVTSLTELFGGR